MKSSVCTLLVVSLLSFNAFAQRAEPAQAVEPTMTLTGAVYDENGAVIIRGTKIVARGSGGKVYEAGVSEEGIYTLRLPLGVYRLEAEALHFCTAQVNKFRIVNATHGKMALDFVLEVGSSHTPCTRKMSGEKKPGGARRQSEKIVE